MIGVEPERLRNGATPRDRRLARRPEDEVDGDAAHTCAAGRGDAGAHVRRRVHPAEGSQHALVEGLDAERQPVHPSRCDPCAEARRHILRIGLEADLGACCEPEASIERVQHTGHETRLEGARRSATEVDGVERPPFRLHGDLGENGIHVLPDRGSVRSLLGRHHGEVAIGAPPAAVRHVHIGRPPRCGPIGEFGRVRKHQQRTPHARTDPHPGVDALASRLTTRRSAAPR